MKTANSFTGACLCCVVAATGFVASPVARGQSVYACDEGRPFTALKVEHIVGQAPDGTEFKQDFVGQMARDSGGRVYSEQERIRVEPSEKQAQDAGESALHYGHPPGAMINSTIWISDCHSGKDITVYPDLKTARISKNSSGSSRNRKNGASLFEFLAGGPRPPSVIFEDLGLKEVEGVLTHGYKNKILGTQDDGEWNGRVKYVAESWISDDLSEIVLQILTNVRAKIETRITLTDIKREEPVASLFEIPAGYKVDPLPEGTHSSESGMLLTPD